MSLITFNDLSRSAFQKSFSINESIGRSSYVDKHVFLSYSHADAQWVAPIVRKLNNMGANIYVDYLDDDLVGKSNEEAAKIIREKINLSKKFISLFTFNSDKSQWMSWELGLGDGLIKYQNVAILPVVINQGVSFQSDFKKIYGYIEQNDNSFSSIDKWQVVYPNGTKKRFTAWINE